jgi:hypothetical protein
MPIDTDTIWRQWCTALRGLITGPFDAASQTISFAGTTLLVDLADPVPAITNQMVFQLGNTIPAQSPAYAPLSDLVSTYATFLDWINLGGDPNPNLTNQLNLAAGAVTTAQSNFNAVMTAALAQYQTFKTATGSDVSFATYAGTYYPTFAEAKNALSAAESAYQGLCIQVYGPGYSTIADARNRVSFVGGARDVTQQTPFNMAVESGSIAPLGSVPTLPGQTPPPPSSALVSSFAPLFSLNAFGATYPVWQVDSNNKKVTAGPIVVTGASSASDWSVFGWSAALEASLFAGFFSLTLRGSTSGTKLSINTASSNFKLSVSFTGLGTFPLAPGAWYQGGIVQTYKSQLKTGAPAFFGAAGSMGRVPTAVVLGFEPRISLSLDNADYNEVRTQWQAQAQLALGIGPFKIGSASVSTYGDAGAVKFDDATTSIEIGPVTSTLPVLLAVISSNL